MNAAEITIDPALAVRDIVLPVRTVLHLLQSYRVTRDKHDATHCYCGEWIYGESFFVYCFLVWVIDLSRHLSGKPVSTFS